jgi:hypothetical protein
MLIKLLAEYGKVAAEELERLLMMVPEGVVRDPVYQEWLGGIDPSVLHATRLQVAQLYDDALPAIRRRHHFSNPMMDGRSFSIWLTSCVEYPTLISKLVVLHQSVPSAVVVHMLPDLLQTFEFLPEEWQRTLVLLALPMLARQPASV